MVPFRVRVPKPVLVIPPLLLESKSVILEPIAVMAPALRTLIFPVVKSLIVKGPEPFANVTLPVIALFVRDQAVALAVTEELPFPAPNVKLLAVPEPFVIVVLFKELNPS